MTVIPQYNRLRLKVTLGQVAVGYYTGWAKLAKPPQSARIAGR
jgi:hypothetical protein